MPEENKTPRRKRPVELTVNGQAIPLVPFVENILGDAVVAMVKTLYGGEQPQTIRLDIEVDHD